MFFNKSIASNPEQIQAVQNILAGPIRSPTYIVFGPPGTGKTSTLVEAILQIFTSSERNKILISAGSNSACDEIALRLCKVLDTLKASNVLARIYSRSCEKRWENIDDLLLECSNMSDSAQFYPHVEVLHEFRIVVCTLGVVGKLATGKFGVGGIFTHLFVDEVSASTEAETLVGLTSVFSPQTKFVIAGDHKQLGPILKSQKANDLGLGLSLMERLLARDVYGVDPITGKYNTNLQTRLIRNYRSHPSIVQLYSDRYYDGELLAMASLDDVNLVAKWHHSPNLNYPIIFHSVYGSIDRDNTGPSMCNLLELQVVMDYVKDLMFFGLNGKKIEQSDIGIISPYRKQYLRIQEELNLRQWFGIETGSVEIFQGKEKPIIIASFVRSHTNSLGFLDNPRRLNVTLSRAKSLLILVGNPKTLSLSEDFKYVIDKCRANNTMVGGEQRYHRQNSLGNVLEEVCQSTSSLNSIRSDRSNKSQNNNKKNNRNRNNKQKNKNAKATNKITDKKDENHNFFEVNDKARKTIKKQPPKQKPMYNIESLQEMLKENKPEEVSHSNHVNMDDFFNELPSVPKGKVGEISPRQKAKNSRIFTEQPQYTNGSSFERDVNDIYDRMRKLKLNPPQVQEDFIVKPTANKKPVVAVKPLSSKTKENSPNVATQNDMSLREWLANQNKNGEQLVDDPRRRATNQTGSEMKSTREVNASNRSSDISQRPQPQPKPQPRPIVSTTSKSMYPLLYTDLKEFEFDSDDIANSCENDRITGPTKVKAPQTYLATTPLSSNQAGPSASAIAGLSKPIPPPRTTVLRQNKSSTSPVVKPVTADEFFNLVHRQSPQTPRNVVRPPTPSPTTPQYTSPNNIPPLPYNVSGRTCLTSPRQQHVVNPTQRASPAPPTRYATTAYSTTALHTPTRNLNLYDRAQEAQEPKKKKDSSCTIS